MTRKERELQSDRQILRILRDDGMKKPVIVYAPDDGPNYYSLKIGSQQVRPGSAMIVDVDIETSAYFLR